MIICKTGKIHALIFKTDLFNGRNRALKMLNKGRKKEPVINSKIHRSIKKIS